MHAVQFCSSFVRLNKDASCLATNPTLRVGPLAPQVKHCNSNGSRRVGRSSRSTVMARDGKGVVTTNSWELDGPERPEDLSNSEATQVIWVNDDDNITEGEAWEDGNVVAGEEEYDVSDGNKQSANKRLPAVMRCFDTARIYVKGGDGGRGCVAFRREKFVPKGGPSGGNGGHGGDVYLEGDESLNSLTSFRRQVHFRAQNGFPGQGSDMHGACGSDLTVKVPPGTIVRQQEEGVGLEILRPGQRVMIAKGGRGGRGNLAFKSAKNTAPTLAEFGEKGQELWIDLELRLVADIGIVGVPNAGKSTLLSVVSAARPKVANYPFTTLVPNLGVCTLDYQTTVFADVPGLLEGAHSGVGLGHQFLRHCQRCRVLIHVIDGTSPDPLGDYQAIQTELALFSPELSDKQQVVAYNKMDVPDSSDYWDDIHEALLSLGVLSDNIIPISAATGRGVTELVRRARQVLASLPACTEVTSDPSLEDARTVQVRNSRTDARIGEFTIESDLRGPRLWYVKGEAIERFAQMTDWSYYEAARRFQGVLRAAGITSALKARGIKEGDTVVIGDIEFEHSDDTSDRAMYDSWYAQKRAAGGAMRGAARWPHAAG